MLSFLWTEFSLNFTFHWVTEKDKVLAGLGMPSNFHLILPTAFISWGMFFMAGGDNAAFGKVAVACIIGTIGALIVMPLSFKTADLPDFWGIALWVGIGAFVLVAILITGDWYYVAGTFPAFAATFLWWIATGLDGWVAAPVSGSGLSVDQWTAGFPKAGGGTGAALGLISTPWQWVWFDSLVTLLCGCVLGIVSAKLAAALTPKPRSAEA
ncbi:MAG: DUF1097 family protein [Thermoleophilia bacterium]